ncbi:hypothetical protein KAU51_02835 [Candidatus Parcubacteria bacterium]|nr:hypothetical protein [Candidatus Parcubacteria bacterium]
MAKKKVSFIATKYKNQETQVHFYTKKGERVAFNTVKKVPTQKRVEFYVETTKFGQEILSSSQEARAHRI